jgi:peptidoglycan/xylan/chitin deacetylase (PgdA/CDA1 family)
VVTGRVVTRLPTSRKVVALTFDAGSGAEAVASVVATLTRERVPATFFLTGEFADLHPAAAAGLARRGLVGDHTYTHPHLPKLSDATLRGEVSSARASIIRATGQDPRPLFRFPYGDYDGRTLAVVNGMGYVAVGWTVDTLGWKGRSAGISVGRVADRVAAARSPGAIVLMHLGAASDGSTLDAGALPRIIAEARSAGYGFVTLSQLRTS